LTLVQCRQALGEDHRVTLWAASTLAKTLRVLDQPERAHHLDENTLARCRMTLGGTHRLTLMATAGLEADRSALGGNERRPAEFAGRHVGPVRSRGP